MSNSENEHRDSPQDDQGKVAVNTHYAPGTFIEIFHKYFSGKLFLFGMVLLTVGHVVGAIVNFNLMSLMMRAFVVLPVVNGWLLFVASKFPKLPEKVFIAVKLEKIDAIIGYISCIGIIAVYTMVYIFSSARRDSYGEVLILTIPILFFVFSASAPYLFYLQAQMLMLNDIRINIRDNSFRLLRGIKVYAVLGCVGVLFNIVDSIAGRGAIFTQDLRLIRLTLPHALSRLFTNPSPTEWFCLLFTLISGAGLVIKIITFIRVRHAMTQRRPL